MHRHSQYLNGLACEVIRTATTINQTHITLEYRTYIYRQLHKPHFVVLRVVAALSKYARQLCLLVSRQFRKPETTQEVSYQSNWDPVSK